MMKIETTQKGEPVVYSRMPITYQEYEDALKELFGEDYINELNTKSFDKEIFNSEIFDAVNSEIAEATEAGLFTRACKLLSVRDFMRHIFLVQKRTTEELSDDRR